MKESGLTPPRMPKEWETARKSGFQTESQQPSPSMQSHKASTMSGGGAAPPGCRLGSRTTGDRAHCLAGPSRQRKTKAGQESSTICSELAPAGRERGGSWWRRGALGRPAAACGCGEAPCEEGELRSTRLQPAGVGRPPVKKGSFGAPGCSLRVRGGCGQAGWGASMGLIGAVFSDSSGWSCWKRQKSGKLSAGFIEPWPLWARLSQGLGFLGRGCRG